MGTNSTHALGQGKCSRCDGKRKKASSTRGYCQDHEVKCHRHPGYAFLVGDECSLCKVEAQRAEQEKKKKKAAEQAKKAGK